MTKNPAHHLILYAIALDLFAIIWFVSASIGTYIFRSGTFIEQAFTPSLMTTGIRIVVAIAVIWTFYLILRKSEHAEYQASLKIRNRPLTLLVMLENPALGKLIRDTLLPLGYGVFEASCSEEALKLSHSLQDELDYLVIDMDMAELSGQEMVETVRSRIPWVEVVYMSSDGAVLLEQGNRSGAGQTIIPQSAAPNRLAVSMHNVMNTDDEKLKRA